MYEGYVPMEYADYLKTMSKYISCLDVFHILLFYHCEQTMVLTWLVTRSGSWGDHVTLQAAADSVKLPLIIFMPHCWVANYIFLMTVRCQDSCINFIQRYLLHRDTPQRPKIKKRWLLLLLVVLLNIYWQLNMVAPQLVDHHRCCTQMLCYWLLGMFISIHDMLHLLTFLDCAEGLRYYLLSVCIDKRTKFT